ncbi:MAG: hypothetical protein KIS78_05965 [Labilithrix sp.]|nr:hypothetical protein [Labilithrix sp.]
MKSDRPNLDDALERSLRRAFSSADELAPHDDDDERVAAAIERTLLAARSRARPPARRSRALVYLVAAALCIGALAYAAERRISSHGPPPDERAATALAEPEPPATGPASESAAQAPAPAESPAPPERATTPEALPEASAVAPRVAVARAPASAVPSLRPAELFARANDASRERHERRDGSAGSSRPDRFPDTRGLDRASRSGVCSSTAPPSRARALFEGYLEHDPSGRSPRRPRVGGHCRSRRCALGDRAAERAAWLDLLSAPKLSPRRHERGSPADPPGN